MRRIILGVWLAFALISVGVGTLLFNLYQEGEHARVARGLSDLRAACESIGAKYNEGLSLRTAAARHDRGDDLDAVVNAALAGFSGVEGGVWNQAGGFIGYGYPTYGGTMPKTDIPQAEMPAIRALSTDATVHHDVRSIVRDDQRETVLIVACPLAAPPPGVVAWTLVRIHSNGANYEELLIAVAVLLAFIVVSGGGLGLALHRRSVRFAQLEAALDTYSTRPPQTIALTGDPDIDRVVVAVNALGTRLNAAQQEAERLNQQVVQSERLAALGRLSAALAHEIRNPLAAMRLKIENAQAETTPSSAAATLDFALTQVARLETLVKNLLAMTQTIKLERRPTHIAAWVDEHIESLRLQAQSHHVEVIREGNDAALSIDPFQLGRALDNLIVNAIEHAPPESAIVVELERTGATFFLRVRDTGPGVDTSIREHLFEPFVSARAEGTGLGLTMVRDIVRAHGGDVTELAPTHGACFQMELPCLAS